jgi:hypothetical protein
MPFCRDDAMQERFASLLIRVLFCKEKDVGSVDIPGSAASQQLAF